MNKRTPGSARYVDSVMTRFMEQGIPIVHLTQIEQLANQYGLPIQPAFCPDPGEGLVAYRYRYNPWLAGGVLLAIIASLYTFVRSDMGYRLLQSGVPKKSDFRHEPMV